MDLDSRAEERIQLLSDSDNRAIVTVLDETDHPIHVEELAEQLVARETTIVSSAEYETRIEETSVSLHHDRLPRLAEAGLVEYDPETNLVAHRSAAAPDAERHEAATIDELLAYLPTDPLHGDENALEVIEGRESIVQYGRRLADEAEEELFCMYVSTDLLEDECIRRAERALDRGVTMYLGSQNPEVRDLTRKHLPEVTIWEPQLDWLNAPTYPRVGRLVLVDRRKVMLAILQPPDSEETYPDETAVVAEGEEHPLVVLVRELLGPRLDHLDYQSEAFRNELSL